MSIAGEKSWKVWVYSQIVCACAPQIMAKTEIRQVKSCFVLKFFLSSLFLKRNGFYSFLLTTEKYGRKKEENPCSSVKSVDNK